MRNPFRRNKSKDKKEEGEQGGPIREPWKRKPDQAFPPTRSNKTMIGRKPHQTFIEQNKPSPPEEHKSSFGSGYQCPECSYPLIYQVSFTTPCPNCGFSGEKVEEAPKPVSNAKRTVAFSSLTLEDSATERKFSLINESNPDMSISAELGDHDEVILNREVLDPGNSSISEEGHILLQEKGGVWMLKDISSNGATFIQALDYQVIYDGIRIILGNRIFRFSTGASSAEKPQVKGNRTMQFGQFSLGQENQQVFTLTDELNGSSKKFEGEQVDLNRDNLKPNETSISSKLHASIEQAQSRWRIIDRSSNKATFVQVSEEKVISDQTRLILGNKVFRFELG